MNRLTDFTTIIALIAALAAGPASADSALKISGDPCSLPLAMKLTEAFSANNSTFKAEMETVACTQGVFKAAAGKADIGVSTQNGLSSNLPKGGVNTVIAKSPIVLIVHRSNPVNDLKYEQLQGILSGEIKNWKEVGGEDTKIKNVLLEPCVVNTMSKQVIPTGKDVVKLKPEGKVDPVLHTNIIVSEHPGAIGEQIYGYESKDVKVLTIDGFLPDSTTLPAQYSFYQDYNIVTKGQPEGMIKDFITFASSAAGKAVITSMNHIPVE